MQPPSSTPLYSSAASDGYKGQYLLRPAPPRAVVCDNFLAVATSPSDLARQVGLAYLTYAPLDLHTAMGWALAAACRRRDWAPPPILDTAVEETIHRCRALTMIPADITTKAATLLPRHYRDERPYRLTAAFLRLSNGPCLGFPPPPISPADCWPATVLAWDLANASAFCLREAAHRYSTQVGLGATSRDILHLLLFITAVSIFTP